MSGQIDFRRLARSIADEKGYAAILPVLEKELLHYEILRALDNARLLERLVFQGGTSLRLCYGSERFSEDLGFAGGGDFDGSLMLVIKDAIEAAIVERYDVEVTVKEPKRRQFEQAYPSSQGVSVDCWQIRVITQQGRPDIPQQKIKLEVAGVPAHTRVIRPLINNYSELPYGYANILVLVESIEEIVVDKLFALSTASYTRYRDIWDLRWLSVHPQFEKTRLRELMEKKIKDYHFKGDFRQTASELLERLPDLVNGAEFMALMSRFLPTQTIDATLNRALFRTHLAEVIHELYDFVLR
ncbi:MAG: nucleotidyl transferase AbiEii/AbiGii toxin family protein [Coriobacteriales bacterium]|jgi:predicted nucleotidyltransferase component of viral defense system|nr:nucleotidyl transferase AbiEii/AbiGii toxin family protein [Coriobacteriales bacterium]